MDAHPPALPFELDPLIAEAKRRARRRRVILAAGVVALAGLAVGLALAFRSPGGSGGNGLATVSYGSLSLRYPAAWARVDCHEVGVEVVPTAVLTTAQPAPGCSGSIAPMAWPPPQRLGGNGVSVALATVAALPAPVAEPTWNARLGGRRADVLPPVYGHRAAADVTCPAGVRREYRAVSLRGLGSHETIGIGAVICGPDLAAGEAAFNRLLQSIRFTR